ncbi:hypothetical protein G3580_00390 [Nitrogeniibacter mangrovi]|uniref:DNA repair protein n=1 Tax=Nitrogeniibacter mangrovi TaxID=2016596 RepID=A0A6C1AZZ4_9RHOO|nr:hypothetical protein [Nitrogeniibacter mangrovi]QID16215.1 hypothetical protein G3580_00390 [Nitrogeniibacter mangrovi]
MLRLFAIILAGLLASAPAQAQSAGDAQIRQLRLQVRQSMQAARDAQQAAAKAQSEVSAAQAEKADIAASLDKAESARGALASRVRALQAERKQLEARVAKLEADLAAERDAGQQTRAKLDAQTRARARAEADGARQGAALRTCRVHNGELAGAADDLLHAYEAKGIFSVLGEAEPFTGIGRVRLENLIETYRDKVDAAREPAGGPADPS